MLRCLKIYLWANINSTEKDFAVNRFIPRNFPINVTPLLWRFPKSWNPYNVKSFLTDISLSVAQIKKFQKTRWFYFLILLLGGPYSPSQLVPNPFNWSPNTVFYRYLCIGRSNKKNSKNKVVLFSNFASGRTLPTQSTGPQPIQLVPKHRFLHISLYRSLKSKKFKRQGGFIFEFCFWEDPPQVPTQSILLVLIL